MFYVDATYHNNVNALHLSVNVCFLVLFAILHNLYVHMSMCVRVQAERTQL